MKKKSFLVFFSLMLGSILVTAQSTKLDKKLAKANKFIDKNKVEKADKYLDQFLKKHPRFGEGWDLLVKIRYYSYIQSKKQRLNFTVTTKNKEGNEVEDSLSNLLKEILNSYDPAKVAFNKFKYTMRKALLYSDDAFYTSSYLRIFLVDQEIDTNISEKAVDYFKQAEEQFMDKNYNDAANLYKDAIDEDPNYYKAYLYLGDSYYFMEYYLEAAKIFKKVIKKFPRELEPRKYLVDAYAMEGLYKKALEEAIKAMAVYPDLSMVLKLKNAVYKTDQHLSLRWTPRSVFPNRIEADDNGINKYRPEHEIKPSGPWVYYVNAFEKIKKYCDSSGIIVKDNKLTGSQYMEVFSWEEMLKNSNDPILNEARRMQNMGYLDCYVLVTCFHYDFLDQYLDFARNNKDKIEAYYHELIE